MESGTEHWQGFQRSAGKKKKIVESLEEQKKGLLLQPQPTGWGNTKKLNYQAPGATRASKI